jgi:hypothetical protein
MFDLKISRDSSLSKWLEMTDEQKGEATLQMAVHYNPYLIFLGGNNINSDKPLLKVTL